MGAAVPLSATNFCSQKNNNKTEKLPLAIPFFAPFFLFFLYLFLFFYSRFQRVVLAPFPFPQRGKTFSVFGRIFRFCFQNDAKSVVFVSKIYAKNGHFGGIFSLKCCFFEKKYFFLFSSYFFDFQSFPPRFSPFFPLFPLPSKLLNFVGF